MMVVLHHQVIFDCLKRSGVVHVAASEENPTEINCEYQNNLDQKNVDQNNMMSSSIRDIAYMDESNQRNSINIIENVASIRNPTAPEEFRTSIGTGTEAEGYSVAFDPLDGSSIVDANFAVGTIMGIWPGNGLLNRKGKEQVIMLDIDCLLFLAQN